MRRLTGLFVAMLLGAFSFAQTQVSLNADVSELKVKSATQTTLQLENKIQSMQFDIETTDLGDFSELNLNRYVKNFNLEPGSPALPVFSQLVEVPHGADIVVTIVDYDEEIIDLDELGMEKLAPVQPSYRKSVEPSEMEYIFNSELYASNQWFETEHASAEFVGIMRGLGIGRIDICPFKYNPVTNELLVMNNMKLDISFENADLQLTDTKKNQFYSPAWEDVFSKLLNYQAPAAKDALTTYPIKYVIVSDAAFEATLQPFVQWKTKSGYEVVEAYIGTDVSNTTASIKTYLENIYNSADPMTYVLFVGDYDNLTAYDGQTQNDHVTDLYYCEYDGGSDYIPDVYYGRISAESTGELQAALDKILPYEQYTIPDGSFLNNTVLIAGVDSDSYDGFSTTHADATIYYATNEYFNAAHDFTNIYAYYHTLNGPSYTMSSTSGASDGDIRTKINNGVSFANYTAHCSSDGWYNPSFTRSDISSMSNVDKYPVMVGNCCQSNKFEEEDAFGEMLLYAVDKGAVAYIGTTDYSYWDEDVYWGVGLTSLSLTEANADNHTYANTDLGAYDGMWHENGEAYTDWHYTTKQIIHLGNLAVTSSTSSLTEYYWEIYQVFGDPSMMPYLTEPEAMTVTYTEPNIGATSLAVTCEPYTYVAISQNNVLLDAKWSGANTSVNLSFTALTSDAAAIVATKQDRVPHINDFTPITPNPPVADFTGTPTTILEGESVSFTDNSQYASTWSWTFGDGGTSTDQNPTYTYTTAGTYTVTLTVTNALGNDMMTKTDYITVNVNTSPPTADFEADQTAVNVGTTVNFTDLTSDNPTSWSWSFTGGDPTSSTDQNPSITYNVPGTYTVSLTATNAYGNSTETKTDYITVTAQGFSMDFEDCVDYSTDFTPWTSLDEDGKTTFQSSDCDFTGEGTAFGFMAFNPSDAGFGLASTHGGDRVGMAICPGDGSQSDNWMISNQLSLGSNSSFSLWVLSPKPGSWGNDSYEVLVSTTGSATTDFTVISGGTAIEAPDTWTQHTYDLSAYDNQDIYLAVRHVATDMFMFWVDDMEIATDFALPYTADFSADATTVQIGESVTFTDLSSGSPVSWNWTFGDGGNSTQQNPVHAYSAAGVYTVELLSSDGTDNDTETKVDYITVTLPAPVADFSATPTTTCDGVVQFNDASSDATSWSWDFGDGNSSTEQNPEHTYAADGTYTVTLTATNATGSDTHSLDVTVEIPDATIAAVSDLCENASAVTLSAATTGGTWTGTGVSGNTFNPTTAGSGDHIISYEVTIGTCTDNDQITIHVDAMPDGTISAVADQCENGTAVTLSAATAGGTWSGTGVTGNTFNPSIGEGDYTVSYEVSAGTCTATDDISIHVDALPSISITDPGAFCTGDAAVTLVATPAGGTWSGTGISGDQFDPVAAGIGTHVVTYEVSNGACTTSDDISLYVSGGYDATIDAVSPLCEADAAITLTAADAGGTWSGTGVSGDQFDPSVAGFGDHTITYTIAGSCGDTDQITIHVDEMPDATITAVDPMCTSETPVTLVAVTAGGTWSGDGVSGSSFDPAVAGIGTHQVSYEVSNGTCTDNDMIEIVVSDVYDATIDAVSPLCEGDAAITLTAADEGGVWTGNGVTGDQFNPAVAGDGDHLITYTISGSCGDTDQITIHVDAMPDATITDPGDFCVGDAAVTLSAATAGGTWSGDGVTGDQFDPAGGLGIYNVSYEVTNGTCTDTDDITILVGDEPTIDLTVNNASSATAADGSASITISGGISPYEVLWSNGSTENSVSGLTPGSYSVMVTDAAGCYSNIPVIIDFTNGIEDNILQMSLYPNPANTELFVEANAVQIEKLELVNVLGQTIMSLNVTQDITVIDVSEQQSGIYFVRLFATDGEQLIERIVID